MLPLSPKFFADSAWRHMAAFSQKIGGEGTSFHTKNQEQNTTSLDLSR